MSTPETSPETTVSSTTPSSTTPATSATTHDVPAFGWSAYAERVNGRFAMVGFAAVLVVEAISGQTFLRWAGFVG
jgi:Chlorophyll A-B binding protein